MDPVKATAEWFRSTVFKDESIQTRIQRGKERLPAKLRAARALENVVHSDWNAWEKIFLKQGELLANFEDDYEIQCDMNSYYITYQSLSDQQLRSYFSWRTKLRKGDVRKSCLSFAYLYSYELINQIGATDPLDGYYKLKAFQDEYGSIDDRILGYLSRWLTDYVVYYGLDAELAADSPQVLSDRSILVLKYIQEHETAEVMSAVKQLFPRWLERSKFYATHQEDMDTVIVRVLRRISEHYAARCKRSMVDQYLGPLKPCQISLFSGAVFCDPLKRRDYEYALDEERIYHRQNGYWYISVRAGQSGTKGNGLSNLLKTIDSVMRREYKDRHPVKAEVSTKWILRIIEEEVSGFLAEKQAAEKKKIVLNYKQLNRIRQDAAVTQEKLIVEEEAEMPEEVVPAEKLDKPALAAPADDTSETPSLSDEEYRLLQCLLYQRGIDWVQGEGYLLSVLVDGINEKLYDTFQDCVLDDTPQVIEDYINDLKEMVHP